MTVREKILDAAYKLFCDFGYEKTSVQKIVEKSGTSKGGFYHHFATKEEVVEAIAVNFVQVLEKRYDELLKDVSLSVFERMNAVFGEVISYKKTLIESWPGISRMLSFEGNIRIIQSMGARFEKAVENLYHSIILQGVQENVFHTRYPAQTANLFAREIINIYSLITRVIMSGDEENYNEFVKTLEFTESIFNHSLGLKEHKILIKDEALVYVRHAKDNYKGVIK